MIKINLLPGYILEARRVKRLMALLGALVVLVALGLAAYVWAPAPFSLQSRLSEAEQRYEDAWARAERVRQTESEALSVEAQYAGQAAAVSWVEEVDRIPERWVRYYSLLNKYIPSDVVVSGLPVPSGTTLTLTGQTSSLEAAARWYLSMLRCEMVDASLGPTAVQFQTSTPDHTGQLPEGPNPKMQQPVMITIAVRPEYLDMLHVPAPPARAAYPGTPASPQS